MPKNKKFYCGANYGGALGGNTHFIESQGPLFRSSCPEVFCKRGGLKNFGNFAGKHLCQCLFFHKVAV